ncbi:Charged multivesicular body protein [Wickerhamomyces ciferrii]|uniref:Charged multivesicular body protein n=1 Tax=Wickerhamomyces ciferrii (strain ATCC 14091 / BCRC 22168 / CBS 111 / JCM 3599 / NBRC 0793 / NRRL Y-1031 F-60-10) TaxID=1206466 RepID=K0KS62_WICCF|nr:Charged multivesicular body protein [Wickerhamomyces ciferrii]CCH46001.1 Charged multivesicular body protein [Wickerhamomyces ciferrii]
MGSRSKRTIRRNGRQLEKSIREISALEKKTETLIKSSARKEDNKAVKIYAKELYGIKKQKSRLHKSKAQLDSVGMQIDESFGMLKLQENMKLSSGIMKEVNSLVKLPELTGTMRDLSQELVKSGIINEMVGDTVDLLDENDELEDEEVDEEVNKIISDLTKDKFNKIDNAPDTKLETPQVEEPAVEEDEDDEQVLNEMRERLKALQN